MGQSHLANQEISLLFQFPCLEEPVIGLCFGQCFLWAARMRYRASAVAHRRTKLSLPRFWERINLMSVKDLPRKLLPNCSGMPKPPQFLLRRYHGLRIYIPSLGERRSCACFSFLNMFVVLWRECVSPPAWLPRWWSPATPCSVRSYLLPVSWDRLFHQQPDSPDVTSVLTPNLAVFRKQTL
jgi:hypothetical protein